MLVTTPTFYLETLTAAHLRRMALQPHQQALAALMTDDTYGRALVQAGPAYTGLVDGRVLACAGFCEMGHGRAVAWALLAEDIGPWFVRVHRAVRDALQRYRYRRIETTVQADFAQGQRWAALLGFQYEGRLWAYGPHGEDHLMYSMVRR